MCGKYVEYNRTTTSTLYGVVFNFLTVCPSGKEGTHPLGNANVVAVQVTTRRHAVTLYKKAKTMEKASAGNSKLLFGNWVNKRKPLPSTDMPLNEV
ncbi:unnamed protein product [Brassica rapa]|uniref:Uncharacterized protein n=2 Tax=Brassica TaxID=3705 RepID=A0A8D9GSV0_BRACM|nr:unnamed protein product [Brassica napus]CAG7885771.1 unnamed protein product [Brassica rapa]